MSAAALLIDPGAFALVVIGAALLASAQTGSAGLFAAGQSLRTIFYASDHHAESEAADNLVRAAAATVDYRGQFAADTLYPRQPFLRAVVQDMADAPSADDFARREAARVERGQAPLEMAAAWWGALADAAPPLGMAGTVGGMILLFGSSDGVGQGGAATAGLAAAMVTTLYGLSLSSVIAGPMAARLDAIAAVQRARRTAFVAEMHAILARALPGNAPVHMATPGAPRARAA